MDVIVEAFLMVQIAPKLSPLSTVLERQMSVRGEKAYCVRGTFKRRILKVKAVTRVPFLRFAFFTFLITFPGLLCGSTTNWRA
jgi:hypothetical protein